MAITDRIRLDLASILVAALIGCRDNADAPLSNTMNEKEYPQSVVVTIWEHIEPIDRGDRYEEPLFAAIEGNGDVLGGGSQFSPKTGIEFVNIEIELASLDSISLVKSTLEAQGCPKGSEIRYTVAGRDVIDEFGVTECVGVFLDGIGLPDEVYRKTDINELAERLSDALGENGKIRSSWAGETETSIFVFGSNAEEIFSRIEPVLNTYPLCRNARVVIRHGKPSLNPREVRVPLDAN